LKKEHGRLSEENKSIVDQTQEIAISNYKIFIQTSECSRQISREFIDTEKRLNNLIEHLPNFTKKCEEFVNTSNEINVSRRLNSITLKRNAQLLEILELPQLMDTCIQEEKYEEALELATYVQRLGAKHGNIPIIKVTILIKFYIKYIIIISFDLFIEHCFSNRSLLVHNVDTIISPITYRFTITEMFTSCWIFKANASIYYSRIKTEIFTGKRQLAREFARNYTH